MSSSRAVWMTLAASAVLLSAAASAAAAPAATTSEPWPRTEKELWPLGVFEKQNLDKPRPKPPFDLTGTWTMKRDKANGDYNFLPLPKLTPVAQHEYDAMKQAAAEGKAYKDDTAACWPYGMPRWLTRVWPIQFMQYPTVVVAIQGLENSVRWIYLDGRGHANPDLIEQTYNGDSVGRWEGDTLVIDTTNLQPKRHWMMQGVPTSDKLHIVERIRMAKDGQSFTDEITMTDPVDWEGEWKNTKVFVPVKGEDVVESHCLPDLDEHLAGTQARNQKR